MALMGLAFLLFGWILVFVLPATRFFAWIILAIGAGVLVFAAVVDFRAMRKSLASGRGRFGVGTSLSISLFLGIVLLANAISVTQYHRFDFTGFDQFTLSSQTRDVLAELEPEVEIVTIFTPTVDAAVSAYARELLEEYAAHTDRLTIVDVDPELQPDRARRYGLTQTGARLGVVVFRGEHGERRVPGPQISAGAENAFTAAILEVSGVTQKRVYYLTGHGEPELSGAYREAAEGLLDSLFSLRPLDLARSPRVPEDASVLIIAGPSTDLASVEVDRLTAYLENNGSLLMLLDPNPPQSYRELLSNWWIRVEDGIVIDPVSFVAPYRSSPLVPAQRNGFQVGETFFSGSTAILPVEQRPAGVEIAPLVWTSNEAWLERSDGPDDEATFDPDVDRAGPLALGVVVARPAPDSPERATRIVVFGDSDFVASRNFRNGGNSSLFLTAVNWLTAGEEIVSIDRRALVTRRLVLNPEQVRFLHFSSVALLPFVLLVAGAYVWWRRRQ